MPNPAYSPDHDACGVGFVTRLGGSPSHEIVERALMALLRLSHRGGLDADGRSGDGAGLLMAIPDRFMRDCALELGISLPSEFGLGMVLLPVGHEDVAASLIEVLADENGLQCLGWRAVPTNPLIVGPRALDTLPIMRQCFFRATEETQDLEKALFRLRKQVEAEAPHGTYFCSLSSRTVVYKGLVTPDQLPAFYSDLADPGLKLLLLCSISVIRRTRSPVGHWRSPSASWRITERSTQSARIVAGCRPSSRTLGSVFSCLPGFACSRSVSAIQPASITVSNCC